MPALFLQPRARLFHGHDWVYGGEISHAVGAPQPGDVVELRDKKNRMLGSAIYNPRSQIVARRFSYRKQDLDADFFQRRFQRAREYRERRGIDTKLCRMVWSESDGLPGVIVDRYGDWLVLQTLTLAMDMRKDAIVEALVAEFAPKGIVERNEATVRTMEGLEPVGGMLYGEDPGRIRVEHDGISFQAELAVGQKTGLYLDQLGNYPLVAAQAKGRRVLDCFCNQGGFALHAAKAGAESVEAVDSSAPALAMGKENAAHAGLNIRWHEANAFDFLKQAESEEARYDLIILDPPSFAKGKHSLQGALRGYKEIHLRALKMLEPAGLLATFSCSHHVGAEALRGIVTDAAVDAKRCVRVVETYGQRADHPVNPLVPETSYLQGLLLEVIPSW
jgi:23S rRNA (cytosine1962-C5)-methyltransferase